MKLPEWVSHAVCNTQREQDLHEAIVIAWETLDAYSKSDLNVAACAAMELIGDIGKVRK